MSWVCPSIFRGREEAEVARAVAIPRHGLGSTIASLPVYEELLEVEVKVVLGE